jgi:hypothetical protein
MLRMYVCVARARPKKRARGRRSHQRTSAARCGEHTPSAASLAELFCKACVLFINPWTDARPAAALRAMGTAEPAILLAAAAVACSSRAKIRKALVHHGRTPNRRRRGAAWAIAKRTPGQGALADARGVAMHTASHPGIRVLRAGSRFQQSLPRMRCASTWQPVGGAEPTAGACGRRKQWRGSLLSVLLSWSARTREAPQRADRVTVR